MRRGQWLILAGILLIAGILRLTGLAWDDVYHYHPDERYITWAATSIEWPENLKTAFSPHQSPINPYYWPPDAESTGVVVPQAESRAFAYGHLPLYLVLFLTRAAEWIKPISTFLNQANYVEYDRLAIIGRVLTALVDVGMVGLIFLLGKRVYGMRVGLLAAAFLAVNVMHIQLAHFFATDPYVSFFALAAIVSLVYFVTRKSDKGTASPKPIWLAAIFIGLAIGSKFAGIFLFIPLIVTILNQQTNKRVKVTTLIIAAIIAFIIFALTNPFAILDNSCEAITPAFEFVGIKMPALNWHSCFLQNMGKQSGLVSGAADVGFTRQYAGTSPYLYFFEMQWRWGMAPFLGTVGIAGIVWLLFRFLTKNEQKPLLPGETIILAWVIPFMLLTGGSFVKFPRYWQPITPFFMLMAAALLWHIRQKKVRLALIALVLLPTTFYAVAFVNQYQQLHPWVAASRWLFAEMPAGTTIHIEQWDDPLPTSIEFDGKFHSRHQFAQSELTWLTDPDERDNLAKLNHNLTLLAEADYLTIASNRVYGVVSRLPQRYPISSQYHALLFSGQLGFDVVYVGGRSPQLAGIKIMPDPFAQIPLSPAPKVVEYIKANQTFSFGRFDESFTVYDQPLVIILENKNFLSVAELREKFDLD